MSDETTTQAEQDAAVIADMREAWRVYDGFVNHGDNNISYEEYSAANRALFGMERHIPPAVLRTIDAQATEITRLRGLLGDVPELLSLDDFAIVGRYGEVNAKIAAIRDALNGAGGE